MIIHSLVVILVLAELHSILTINIELINLEENLLYSHIKTKNDLDSFYQKLIQSNGIDDAKLIRNVINENDIRELNFEHKVNIKDV
jgi:hypothetical protein